VPTDGAVVKQQLSNERRLSRFGQLISTTDKVCAWLKKEKEKYLYSAFIQRLV